MSKYQRFKPLSKGLRFALKNSLEENGVLVPIDVDENDEILDGHHRAELAAELGIACPKIVRKGLSEAQKKTWGLIVNLLRRQMQPHAWGHAFKALLKEIGVDRGRGANQKHSATVAELAAEVGVPERTARHRMKLADDYEELPKDAKDRVDKGESSVPEEAAKRTKPEPTKNGHGLDRLTQAKEAASRLRQIATEISRLKKEVIEIAHTPVGTFIREQWVETHAGNLINTINAALPYARCSYCQGDDKRCKACRGLGWVTRDIDNVTVPELKR